MHEKLSSNGQEYKPRLYFIYILLDPRDGSVRYVGQTSSVQDRYRSHLSGATQAIRKWVKELKGQEILPILDVIEELPSRGKAEEREQYWIDFFLAEDEPLYNYVSKSRRTDAMNRFTVPFALREEGSNP